MLFHQFKVDVDKSFGNMTKGASRLYKTDVSGDQLWDAYINSFPEGEERQSHNCHACHSFIKHYGNVVAIVDNKIVSYWSDVHSEGYENTAKAMAKVVLSAPIVNVFLTTEKNLGIDRNREMLESGQIITWEHLFTVLPNTLVFDPRRSGFTSIDAARGQFRDSKNVCKRSLDELTEDSVLTVLELIAQNSLYRGAEFQKQLEAFRDLQRKYRNVPVENRDNFCWEVSRDNFIARIRNTAIGTLLEDISLGIDIEIAVSKFESIMAPANYKRPTAIITKRMVEEAQKKVESLGLVESLPRRHASIDDLTVNNVLFVNRDARKQMADGIFAELAESTGSVNPRSYSKSTEIGIEDFIKNVLPTVSEVEVLVENSHISNLVTLTAPVNMHAPSLFRWNNNFAWAYNGNVADSFKEKVKAAGGNVNGVLRCSLHWFNYDDLDIHVVEPNGNKIFFSSKKSATSGALDIDMNAGSGSSRDAVENIIWTDANRMREGVYELRVNNFAKRESIDVGFECEIECNGEIFHLNHDKAVPNKGTILVAKFKWSRSGGVEILESISSTSTSKSQEIWNISTNKFIRVTSMMMSPNYWDGQQGVGNKHYFFMLEGCRNPDPVRGFFNEYLKPELNEHKRVFEAIGSRMQTPYSDNQLSGVGFSSTQHNSLIVRVKGATTRILKIKF